MKKKTYGVKMLKICHLSEEIGHAKMKTELQVTGPQPSKEGALLLLVLVVI